MCDVWGGCGGGEWDGCPDGGCPAIADNSLTVGRHSLKGVAALGGNSDAVAQLRALAAEAHEYSTTAGGRCDLLLLFWASLDPLWSMLG